MSHGVSLNVNYAQRHSIEQRATWHSGATTANGAAGGEGFTSNPLLPRLDRGNSIYDIRQRLVISHVLQLPGQNLKGVAGYVAGGWSLNGIWAFQTGAHWQPYDSHRSKLKEITPVPPNITVKNCTAADVADGNCQNLSGDFLLTTSTAGGLGKTNAPPDSSLPPFRRLNHNPWAKEWCPPAPD